MKDEIAVEGPGVPALFEDETRSAIWNRAYSVLGLVNRNNRSSWADALETLFNEELEEAVTDARNNDRDELSATKLAYAKEIDTLEDRIKELIVENNNLTDKLGKTTATLEKHEEIVSVLKLEIDAHEKTVERLKEERKRAEEIYTSAGNSMAEEIGELKGALAASAEELVKECQRRQSDIKTYVDTINNQGSIVADRDRSIAKLSDDNRAFFAEINSLRSKLTEAGHARRALCETIEMLANVIRND